MPVIKNHEAPVGRAPWPDSGPALLANHGLATRSDNQGSHHRMLECDPPVDRREPFEVARPIVADRPLVRLVRGQAMVEIGHPVPGERQVCHSRFAQAITR